jgi:hypothetical protein
MAPTAGDVGGCGTEPTALDKEGFAQARKELDCKRCGECSIKSQRCLRACSKELPPDTSLPATCHPIHHDGEVCLRALDESSCETYATYVDDRAPATPSECQFCLIVPRPAVVTTFTDGGSN